MRHYGKKENDFEQLVFSKTLKGGLATKTQENKKPTFIETPTNCVKF